jgi:hypothetical protein
LSRERAAITAVSNFPFAGWRLSRKSQRVAERRRSQAMALRESRNRMEWYVYVARFFAGAFIANAVPHFVSGVQGRRFPTPFSSPPGKGESSSAINVVWGSANAFVGYLLLYRVGRFSTRSLREVLLVGVGGFLLALMLSRGFGEIYGGTTAAAPKAK